MNIDEQTIKRLIDEVSNGISPGNRYDLALSYINMDALERWNATGQATADEIATEAAAAGFLAGIRFTLENLDVLDDDPETAPNSDNRPYGN